MNHFWPQRTQNREQKVEESEQIKKRREKILVPKTIVNRERRTASEWSEAKGNRIYNSISHWNANELSLNRHEMPEMPEKETG